MKANIVDAFSRALDAVLTESGFEGTQFSSPGNRSEKSDERFEVSISVGIAGGIKGFLYLLGGAAPARDYALTLSKFFGVELEDPSTFGPMHKAALAELVNQIAGRVTILLSEQGIDTDITPPTIITGDSITTALASGLTTTEIGIHSSAGAMTAVVEYHDG